MLQQTQVDRVVPKYREFLRRFPDVRTLAKAPLSSVLVLWQGLGYNRRAKLLRDMAQKVVAFHAGKFPKTTEELRNLPGIGAYTAGAIQAFAFDMPAVMIETNIRTAFLHDFFPGRAEVPDSALMPLIAAAVDTHAPRRWYNALMDYGAHLKKTAGNASRRSAHHTGQKPFKGSDREIRGALVRAASSGPLTAARVTRLPFPAARIHRQVTALVREGLLVKQRGTIRLP